MRRQTLKTFERYISELERVRGQSSHLESGKAVGAEKTAL